MLIYIMRYHALMRFMVLYVEKRCTQINICHCQCQCRVMSSRPVSTEMNYISMCHRSVLVRGWMVVQWSVVHWDAKEPRSVVLCVSPALHTAGTEATHPLSSTCRPDQRCWGHL